VFKVIWQEAASLSCHLPLVAVNVFIHCIHWVGTFAMRKYVTMGRRMPRSKVPLPVGDLEPPSNTWFFGPTIVSHHHPNRYSHFAQLTRVPNSHRITHRPHYMQHL